MSADSDVEAYSYGSCYTNSLDSDDGEEDERRRTSFSANWKDLMAENEFDMDDNEEELTVAHRNALLRSSESISVIDSVLDWNERFQLLLEKPTTTPEEVRERNKQIEDLSNQFIEAAKPIVEVLVIERHLDFNSKTIKPVDVGGVAGGSKFIVNNMFFKFAKDSDIGMYGGDEWAMKAAGHELKSLNTLIACYIPKVHFPLMALINFLGWRVIVMSLLPIHSRTLVYGSADGARTIHNSSETMNEIMKQVGTLVNLKEHTVKGVPIFGPADMEGHKGEDGRYYIADVSRLFPPAVVRKRPQRTHGSIWFRLLRPEFVMKYFKPLSSDAFSAMGIENKEVNDNEVNEATLLLEKQRIPVFSEEFETWFNSEANRKNIDIKQKLHEFGINCRYMFFVLINLSDPELKRIVIIEMIARCVRKLLWGEMRRLSSRKQIDRAILSYINMLYGNDEKSLTFWRITLIEAIEKRFLLATTADGEQQRNQEYLKHIITILDTNEEKELLFQRLQELVGMEIRFLISDPENWFSKVPLSPEQVHITLNATTKSIKVKPYTQTFDKAEDAIKFYKDELKARKELLGSCHLQVANTRYHLALIYANKGKDYFPKAEKQYLRALEIKEKVCIDDPVEITTLMDQISQFYLQFGEYTQAEDMLQRSLTLKKKTFKGDHPSIAKTLDQLAQLYRKQGQYVRAKPLFKQSLAILQKVLGEQDPVVAITMYNFALLYRQQAKYSKAEPLYHKALSIMEATKGPDHSWVSRILSNLAQLYQLEGKYNEAEPLFERCIVNKKKELGEDHLHTASSLNQLAQLYHKQKKYSSASSLYKDALRIREKGLGSEHYAVGKILDKLAELEREQGNLAAATEYYQRAMFILEKTLGKSHPYFVTVYQKFEQFQQSQK